MKKQLHPGAVTAIAVVFVIVLAAIGYAMLGGGAIGSGAPVEPRKFSPPAGYKAPGAPQGGGPIGAPSNAGEQAPNQGS